VLKKIGVRHIVSLADEGMRSEFFMT
jgi:hypothetical protein